MFGSLRIVYWNADGLSPVKIGLLRLLLSGRRIDVALINETHLRSSDRLKVSGYQVYRKDETSPTSGHAYRGLAVLVKRSVLHQLLPVPSLRTSYALGVEICHDGKPTRVFAFYKPPGTRLDLADIHELLDPALPTVIAGDFNAKHTGWNSMSICPDGRQLFDEAERSGLEVLGPEVPTHYPYNRDHLPDVIDLTVTQGLTAQPTLDVLDEHMLSDHQPVLVTLTQAPARIAPPGKRHRQDWEAFAAYMSEHVPTRPVSTPTDVDDAANEFALCVGEALDASRIEAPTSRRPHQIPAHILSMIERKRRLRRVWQRTRCPTMKTQLNSLAEKISAALETAATESWHRTVEKAGEDWTGIHRLCRQLSGQKPPIRPLQANDGSPRYRAEDRAEIFADHLEEQFRPNHSDDREHEAAIQRHLEDYFARPMAPDEDPIVLSPGQVQRMIRRTKLRKAPGPDRVTNEALRHLPPRAIATLTRTFNGILRTGQFPDPWKVGRVIMLPKPGKNVLLPGSYRPITLLSSTSKLFEKLMLLHLVPHIQPRVEQFGFRAEHSTTHQLSRVLHHMAAAWNRKEVTVAVLLDMEKAFDRVWHPGLLYKLSTSTSPRRLVKTVGSFLEGRRFQVAVENALSTSRPIRAGVPQGSCLSPVCYSWYTDDIPVEEGATLALYADDAAYLASSIRKHHAAAKMQRTLDALPAWLKKWRLSVNVAKTQATMVGRPRSPPPPLTMLGQSIEWTSTVKYLGVTIDRRLTMKKHVSNVVNQVRATRALLRPVLHSRLPIRAKLGIYKAYVRTRLTYAAPAWYALVRECNRRRLRAQQSLALRTIVDAPRFVRNSTISRDLRMESLDDFIGRLTKAMFGRAEHSGFQHLRELAPYHARPPDGRGFPRDLLSPGEEAPAP